LDNKNTLLPLFYTSIALFSTDPLVSLMLLIPRIAQRDGADKTLMAY